MRSCLILFPLLCCLVSYSQDNEKKLSDSLLVCLVGEWKGKGTSFGTAVEDKASFDTVMRSRFVFMKLSAIKGDDFIAEGYLWYNPVKKLIEFYEFNDGAWPVRILTGKAKGNRIILEENTEGRHIRLTFTITKDSFDLEEASIKEGKAGVFVSETFTRIK